MKMLITPFVLIVFCTGCASSSLIAKEKSNELEKLAFANCFMWYLKSKGHDTKDIRAISGGIVEKSDVSLERFQEIALIVKEYHPSLETKNNIDLNLLKCFHLEESEKLNKVLAK